MKRRSTDPAGPIAIESPAQCALVAFNPAVDEVDMCTAVDVQRL
jgi:hypothetical protein